MTPIPPAASGDAVSTTASDGASAEATFRALAEALPHPVWSTHPDGTPDVVNARWLAFAGPDARSATWSDRVHPDDAP